VGEPGRKPADLSGGARGSLSFWDGRKRSGSRGREGKHEQNIVDWIALLDFAIGISLEARRAIRLRRLAFPESKRAYGWSKP